MSAAGRRVAFLGPAGTNTDEALRSSAAEPVDPVPAATVHEAIVAVQDRRVDAAVVPIENSLEGGVAATLDALAGEARDVRIEREVVHPIHHSLVAARPVELATVRRVLSHPQALGQCSRFLRERLPGAELAAASSTADAVRLVVAGDADAPDGPAVAIGSPLAVTEHGGSVLVERIEDRPDNVTRFVWLAHVDRVAPPPDGPAKTSIVFWGFNDASPGSLVSVLRELSDRGINMSRIESRPRRVSLGHYMFFADVEASVAEPRLRDALAALEARVETVRVLGCYPAAPAKPA